MREVAGAGGARGGLGGCPGPNPYPELSLQFIIFAMTFLSLSLLQFFFSLAVRVPPFSFRFSFL